MIRFACKVIEKEDVVRCALNLNKTEYNILDFFFKKTGSFSIQKISAGMGLERTTVQKALKGLIKNSLVTRRKKNLDKGGYVFIYELTDRNRIKRDIKKTISVWYKNALRSVEKI